MLTEKTKYMGNDWRTDLYRPGVLIWTDRQPFPLLVGHTNVENGVCGCCSAVERGEKVTHYQVVWEEPTPQSPT